MRKKGFTLIELLVVVAVLALLASIVFSNLGGAREGARISNALSFQSQTHSLLGSDLVGWWQFNEDLTDISGYGNDGSWQGVGSPNYVDGVSGTNGTALELIDTGEYFEIDDIVPEDNFTISLWTKRTLSDINNRYIFDNPNHSFYLINYGNYIALRGSGLSTSDIYRDDLIDNWLHIVISRSNSTVRFFINTEEVSERNASSFSYQKTLLMGVRYNFGDTILGGLLDDVRIYSRALTAQEVEGLYAQTKEKYLAND